MYKRTRREIEEQSDGRSERKRVETDIEQINWEREIGGGERKKEREDIEREKGGKGQIEERERGDGKGQRVKGELD